MKIVYCLTDPSRSGGMERVICNKANYFVNIGYDVTIISTDKQSDRNFFNFSSKIKFIDLGINYSELEYYSVFKRLKEQIKKRKEHREKLFEVLQVLQPDVSISTYTHELSMLYKINDGSKKIAEIHFCKQNKWIENINNDKPLLVKCMLILGDWRKKFFARKYDAFVVLTEGDKLNWRGIPKITVIPNALSFYPQKSSSTELKKIISVGRLDSSKGYSFLLDVWSIVAKHYPGWNLSIYGEGEEHSNLEKKIRDQGLIDCVKICSPVSNIQEEYLNSSIYVMSSLHEGFGMVLAEAMSCGLPCVSFDCPYGPSEIITENEDGFLVKTKDVLALADKILYLIENEEQRKRMGANARINIQRYLPENVMPKWIELFQDLLKN